MNIVDVTSKELIFLNKTFSNRDEVFEFMVHELYKQGKLSSEDEFLEAIYNREGISVTGFENGLAIPHGKSKAVREASFAMVRLASPLEDYPSLDPNNKVDLLFMLAIPDDQAGSTHLDILSNLASKLADVDYLNSLKSVNSVDEVLMLLGKEKTPENNTNELDKGLILGVTACAAGIAHTYMSAEAITKAANKVGYRARIEKQGAKGIEDKFTNEELREATGVILAHDVALKGMERFNHLPKVNTKVAEPLKKGDELVEKLLQRAANFSPSESTMVEFDDGEATQSTGQEIKDAILTGISYIIPIIIAGGMISTVAVLITQIFGLQDLAAAEGSWLFLLKGLGSGLLGTLMMPVLAGYMAYSIADKPGLTPGFAGGLAALTINSGFIGAMIAGILAGYTMKWMKKNIKADGIFAGFVTFWVYPVIGSLFVGAIMLFVVGKPIAAINNGMVSWLDSLQGSNALLLGAVLGAMVSFDLGGPVNKAAYAFCIGAMASGNFIPYCTFASVKMVSAFSLSLACYLKKDLFTEQEREIGNQNWLLGLAGITEGAIPFAMGDPIRVIGSFIAGSIVTGAIVAYAGIGLNVPGAGIFSMFLLEGNHTGAMGAAIWLGAAIVGAIISTICLIATRQHKLKKVSN